MKYLRKFIRVILEKKEDVELITEPDIPEDSDEDQENEVSVVANIAGVTTPLGAGPSYPSSKKDKRKPPEDIAGRSFGNAKPAKPKKNKNG